MRETEGNLKILCTGFEGGKRGHELRETGALEAGKDKNMDSPLEPPEGTWSC